MLSLIKRARIVGAALFAAALAAVAARGQLPTPTFGNEATVHDPSVIRVGDRFYVFGSHLQAAWTSDLMNWTQISENAGAGNTLIPNVAIEMAEALAWSSTDTFWAPDVIQLGDGRFYMYYCASRIDAPRASLGLAVADAVEGPYRNEGIFLQSGMWDQISADGTIYDATVHPNAVDPALFFDTEDRLWMVYGSYSGGIFVMEMDPATGLPLPGQGYGKKLLGGNHSRIEGAYVLFYPETGYYYLFVSFGGLAADGGYNVRVARSRSPDGPYLDSKDADMIEAKGASGTLFDDASIAPYGVKLMGNARFLTVAGEPETSSRGYVSPGHNSAYYDVQTGKSFIFFHTRFVGNGELHQVRVHQLYFNEDDWPVLAPHRYAGESRAAYQAELFFGRFKIIEHGKDITAVTKESELVEFVEDGTISGAKSGSWELVEGETMRVTLGEKSYTGVASHQWDDDNGVWVMAFSALSADGEALWGSKVATELSLVQQWRLRHFGATGTVGDAADAADPDGDGRSNFREYAQGSDPLMAETDFVPVFVTSAGAVQAHLPQIFDPDLEYSIVFAEDPTSGEWEKAAWEGEGSGARIRTVDLWPESTIESDERRFWRLQIDWRQAP